MRSILAFDASGDCCSVTLKLASGFIHTLQSSEPRSHAAKLLPFTQTLLDQANCNLADIDVIACSAGPGSFTGLRIALSVAQGLAYASNKSIILINSLAAMVQSVDFTLQPTLCLPLMDARIDEVYWGAYSCDGRPLDSSVPALMGNKENFLAQLKMLLTQHSSVVALGQAWQTVPFAQAALTQLNIELINTAEPHSLAVAQLAEVFAVTDGCLIDPQKADLFYCRDSVAWNKRQRIRAL
ncbi:MAG: tRNA (adenosine(37)-N6)-threonylcarbamoyltransferase complex dimerization subunit type 1 TsaB [Marinagarivorans sp.]|nr:tRNA (adenosine(37)-N6)-threonylcarbamoyltransferase complex dimerization subunit type 1 TsaB [Marinagarivorans sp.]